MQWRRKPDGRPYLDGRDAGIGRRSLLTDEVLAKYGPVPPDDVCQRLYDAMVAKLAPLTRGQTAQKREYDIPGLVTWYVETYKARACKGTQTSDACSLARWTKWCEKQRITRIDEFDSTRALDYVTALASEYKASTVRSSVAILKAMFRAATDLNIVNACPVRKWPKLARVEIVVRHYTHEQVREVLAAVNQYEPQFYPIILFIAATGWAVGDAAALRHDNIDKGRRVANRNRKKTGVPMLLPLNETAMQAIELSRTFTGLVFPHKRTPKGTLCCVFDALQRAVDRAGIKYKCTLHMFRHTVAVELSRRGTPLAIIAQILGHNANTTLRYYQTFAPNSGAPYMDGWDTTLRGDAEVCHPNVTPFPQSK